MGHNTDDIVVSTNGTVGSGFFIGDDKKKNMNINYANYMYLAPIIIGIVLVLFIILFAWVGTIQTNKCDCHKSSFQVGFDKNGLNTSGASLRFMGEPTDNLKVSGFRDAGANTNERWKGRMTGQKSGFLNSAREPSFSSVTDRELKIQDRQRSAIAALAKIKRQNNGRGPAWSTYWSQWKTDHPLGFEGFNITNDSEYGGGYPAI
jgi:hypothetical protein